MSSEVGVGHDLLVEADAAVAALQETLNTLNEEERRATEVNELQKSVGQLSPMQASRSSVSPGGGDLQVPPPEGTSHSQLNLSQQAPVISVADPTPPQSLPGEDVGGFPQQELDHTMQPTMTDTSDFSPLPPPGSPPPPPTNFEDKAALLEQQLLDRDKQIHSLTARNESLERLLQASGQTGTSKVKQLTEELARRNTKIKDLEGTINNLNTQIRQKSSMDKRKSMDRNTVALRNLEKKLAALEKENDTLRKQGNKTEPSQQVPFTQVQASTSQDKMLLCNARDCINELKMQMIQKEQEIQHLRKKLFDAQSAIMTNVDGIAELDSKLQHSRKAVRWLLRSGSPNSASRSVSPQHAVAPPAYGGQRSLSPAHVLPQYSAANRSSSYNSHIPSSELPAPQTMLRQHDLLGRSHLASEQVNALQELENMLSQRESRQRMSQLPTRY